MYEKRSHHHAATNQPRLAACYWCESVVQPRLVGISLSSQSANKFSYICQQAFMLRMAYQTNPYFPGLCFRRFGIRSDRNFGATLTTQKSLHAQLYYRILWEDHRMPLGTWDRFVSEPCAHCVKASKQMGPIEMPLCRMRSLMIHIRRLTSLCRLYIQNERLSEAFRK